MNLTRLRYFVAVAEELHFGQAAARLHMAQPPLSQQIRRLEREYGADLFERSTRRVKLTNAGRMLYPLASKVLAEADTLQRVMAQHKAGEAGLLRVGFVDSASYAVMPRFLRSFRERWPGVTFELHTLSSAAQQVALRSGQIDIGIARSSGAEAEVSHTLLARERLYLAVPTSHRLANRHATSIKALRDEAFIGFSRLESPVLTEELRSMFSAVARNYDPIIEAEEYVTIIGLVAAGEGIAVVPETVRSFHPGDIAYLELSDPVITTRLMLLTRVDEPLFLVQRAVELAITTLSETD